MSTEPSPQDLAGIEALRQRDIAASKAFDVEGLLANWTEDCVGLLPGMEPVRGREGMRALLLQAAPQARTQEILEYGESFEETQVFGDTALEWGYVWGSERPRAGGEVQRTRYKVMRVLQRQPDGSWRFHRSIFNDAPPAAPLD
jgi:uncharacterized protein (TIGR02246 family)